LSRKKEGRKERKEERYTRAQEAEPSFCDICNSFVSSECGVAVVATLAVTGTSFLTFGGSELPNSLRRKRMTSSGMI
jgi:hypothetical protein